MLLQWTQVRLCKIIRGFVPSMSWDIPQAHCQLHVAVPGGIAAHAARNGHCSERSEDTILLGITE